MENNINTYKKEQIIKIKSKTDKFIDYDSILLELRLKHLPISGELRLELLKDLIKTNPCNPELLPSKRLREFMEYDIQFT